MGRRNGFLVETSTSSFQKAFFPSLKKEGGGTRQVPKNKKKLLQSPPLLLPRTVACWLDWKRRPGRPRAARCRATARMWRIFIPFLVYPTGRVFFSLFVHMCDARNNLRILHTHLKKSTLKSGRPVLPKFYFCYCSAFST